jgi:prevent-host-death family protein
LTVAARRSILPQKAFKEGVMNISTRDAEARLEELLLRAEAGEDVVLTRRGKAVARLVSLGEPPMMPDLPPDLEERRQRLLELSSEMAVEKKPGADAAHSADFLYDEYGLPG